MSCKIIVSSRFKRDAKKLVKKYRSLSRDLQRLQEELLENPYSGTRIGESSYKIRLAIQSKGRGKSGGGRVITHVDARIIEEEELIKVYLLTIYDKAQTESYSEAEVNRMLKAALEEE
ncbi:MAG: hypothetical protein AAFZ52_05015 [Bacteroidota bacterium]